MAGTYGDTPDDRRTSGYLSRWPARELFLTALYELAPAFLRNSLTRWQSAVSSNLLGCQWFATRSNSL